MFQQIIGLPMGTDCAPFLANLFLYSYEYKWLDNKRIKGQYHILSKYNNCSRYIDDLLLINNYEHMLEAMLEIYAEELCLIADDSDGQSTPFLDLMFTIKDKVIYTSIYDKRDEFDFPIVSFPNLSGNVPVLPSYGVFIGELVRYARACSYFTDFRERVLKLINKLKTQLFTDTNVEKNLFEIL